MKCAAGMGMYVDVTAWVFYGFYCSSPKLKSLIFWKFLASLRFLKMTNYVTVKLGKR